jgi:outer membrane protein TolC
VSLPASAGEARRLTLAEAIELATASSPTLAQLNALVRASEAGEDQARAARRPDIDASVRYTRLTNLPEYAIALPDGSRQVIFPNLPNRYSARLGLSVPLYTGGRIRNGITAAGQLTAAAGQDLQAARADLRLAVTDAYLRVVLVSRQEQVIGESIAAFDAHLEDVRNRIRFGLAARNELLAVSVERDRAALALVEATGDRAVAMADLVRLLGLEEGSLVETVAPLDTAGSDGEPELTRLVGEALEQRSERAAAMARLQAARTAVEVERAATRPTVSAAAGYDLARPNLLIIPPRDELDDTWDVSINLGYRLFDGGKTRAAVSRAAAEAEAAEHRLAELDRAIRRQVTTRFHELHTARAALPVAAAALTSAEENLRVARDRFREGLIPSSELLDAEIALLRAGLDQVSAQVRLGLAAAALARAVGR